MSQHYYDPSIQHELSRFDGEYKPEGSNRRAGLEALADGAYEFVILDAQLTRTDKSREAILRFELRVLNGPSGNGLEVEHVYFFRTQAAVNRLGADLVALGLPADRWGNQFSRQLPGAIASLAGRKFRATKDTSPGDDRTFHNLRILGLLAQAGPAPAPHQVPMSRPQPAQPSPHREPIQQPPRQQAFVQDDSELPF